MAGLTSRMAPASAGPGTHEATLADIVEVPGQYGKPAWSWSFRTAEGKRLSVLTGTFLARDTAAGQIAEQAFGRPIEDDEVIDLAVLIGCKFRVVAVPGRDGGAIVKSVAPLDE